MKINNILEDKYDQLPDDDKFISDTSEINIQHFSLSRSGIIEITWYPGERSYDHVRLITRLNDQESPAFYTMAELFNAVLKQNAEKAGVMLHEILGIIIGSPSSQSYQMLLDDLKQLEENSGVIWENRHSLVNYIIHSSNFPHTIQFLNDLVPIMTKFNAWA